MAPPDKRAVAPGAQPVRIDNVKAESWVILDFPPPLIGRIYFPTDSSTLDDDDMRRLETIVNPYQTKLKDDGRRGLNVNFEFYGYTDKRHTKEYNYALAQRRADAVANYLGQPERLGGFSNYVTESKGRGIDYSIDGENSEELKYARRVDIHADHIGPEPKQTPETPETPVSTTWKARIYDAASIGYGVAAADTFFLEIADLKNNLAMSFHYRVGSPGTELEFAL